IDRHRSGSHSQRIARSVDRAIKRELRRRTELSVKAATEKNFRRARVKPGKRRASKRRVSWRAVRLVVVALLVTYAVYRAFDLVVSASALQVQHISVNG